MEIRATEASHINSNNGEVGEYALDPELLCNVTGLICRICNKIKTQRTTCVSGLKGGELSAQTHIHGARSRYCNSVLIRARDDFDAAPAYCQKHDGLGSYLDAKTRRTSPPTTHPQTLAVCKMSVSDKHVLHVCN